MLCFLWVFLCYLRCSINGFKNKCQSLGKAELKILSMSDGRNAHCFEEQTKTELLSQRTSFPQQYRKVSCVHGFKCSHKMSSSDSV